MQIVLNEELKEALEWTCGLVKDYAVDVDVSIYADGEIRISITPMRTLLRARRVSRWTS